jgi:flagellar protein FlaG
MMASEIIGTQAASPVIAQQHFNFDRVVNKSDQGLAKAEVEIEQVSSTLKSDSVEKELALATSEKVVDESKQEEKLADKVLQLNDYAQNINREIQFSVHKETNQTIVKVVDTETDKVIRQLPSEEILKMAESLENFSGMLLKEQA